LECVHNTDLTSTTQPSASTTAATTTTTTTGGGQGCVESKTETYRPKPQLGAYTRTITRPQSWSVVYGPTDYILVMIRITIRIGSPFRITIRIREDQSCILHS